MIKSKKALSKEKAKITNNEIYFQKWWIIFYVSILFDLINYIYIYFFKFC